MLIVKSYDFSLVSNSIVSCLKQKQQLQIFPGGVIETTKSYIFFFLSFSNGIQKVQRLILKDSCGFHIYSSLPIFKIRNLFNFGNHSGRLKKKLWFFFSFLSECHEEQKNGQVPFSTPLYQYGVPGEQYSSFEIKKKKKRERTESHSSRTWSSWDK